MLLPGEGARHHLTAGVLGLPQRLGLRGSTLAAAAALLAAAAIIDVATGFGNPALTVLGTAAVLALVVIAVRSALTRPPSRTAFLATMLAAAVEVTILAGNHGLA